MKSRLSYLLGGFVLVGALPLHGDVFEPFALMEDSQPAQFSPQAAGEPRLTIDGHPQSFTLSWPFPSSGWALEQAVDTGSGFRWSRVFSSLYSNDGALYQFTSIYSNSVRYFRLRKVDAAAAGVTGQWALDEGDGQSAENFVPTGDLQLWNAKWAIGRVGPGSMRFTGGGPATPGSFAWVDNANYQVLPGPNHPFSLSLWFNPDNLDPGWIALAGNDAAGAGWHVALSNPGPGTNILVFAGAGATPSLVVTGRALLLPNQWHHLTATYDGSVGSLYLDHVLLGRSSGSLPTHSGPIYFGGVAGGYDGFRGRLDEIRTYTNCLSTEQIAVRGHWRFDEPAGEVVVDSGIDGHHGTVGGGSGRTNGRSAGGINLATSEISIPNDEFTLLPPTGEPFSLSFWVQPGSLGTGHLGLMSCEEAGSRGWRMYVERLSSVAQFHFESESSGGTLDLAFPISLASGVWTKVDVTYNGGIATGYVNGRAVNSAHGGLQSANKPLALGRVAGMPTFNGVLDEVKIYSGERAAAEIGPVAQTMWETVLLDSTTNLLLQGFGPTGKPLIYSIVPTVVPTNGTVTGIASSALARYAAGSRKGPDAFTYTVSDGEFTSAPAIVTISVVKPHWLSPTGGSVAPLDGSSPDQAWAAASANALDAIWHTNNWYDCFFYAPGEYQVRGSSYGVRSTANPGCKHIGSGETGPARTVLKMIDAWGARLEGTIFVHMWYAQTDAFEVHNMTLDCNAMNLPKFNQGEPIWIHMPLASTGRVETVTLSWGNSWIAGLPRGTVGRAAQFRLSARKAGIETYVTNYNAPGAIGDSTVLPVHAEADELYLELLRRGGVEHYGIREITVDGNPVSQATATTLTGERSRWQGRYDVCNAVDQNPTTFWISGAESLVDVTVPFEPNTPMTQLRIQWKCRTMPEIGRIGPALEYQIRAIDALTGNFYDVPFVRGPKDEFGAELAVFGTSGAPQVIITDRLVIRLIGKEPMVDYYGIKEIDVQNGASAATIRKPSARNYLPWGINHTISQAFDANEESVWVSGTQGEVSAIAVYGNNLKFTHLRMVGFGTRSGKECFVLFCGVPPTAVARALGNVVIEDCTFASPALNNGDGITALVLLANLPSRYTNGAVRRCTFDDLKLFPYSHAASAMHLENCLVRDADVAIYYEPDGHQFGVTEPALYSSNQFINVNFGLYVNSHPGAQVDSLTCIGNEVVLSGTPGWGFAACDACAIGPSGSITNLTLLNNVVRYADWAAHPGRVDGGILYSDIQRATFGNNVIALGNFNDLRVRHCPLGLIPPKEPPDDCDFPTLPPPGPDTTPPCVDTLRPGYRRSWYNNRGLSGELLPIRFLNQGIEGLATQQQWP